MAIVAGDMGPMAIQQLWQGAQGEVDTGKQLQKLDDSWRIRHDLQGPHGNIDHLVLGRPGLYLLDSKAWFGATTTITEDGPRIQSAYNAWSNRTESKLGKRMKSRAYHTSQSVKKLKGESIWVIPVVVIWGDFADEAKQHDGVWYVSGYGLAEWLSEQPERLSESKLRALANVI